MIRNVVIHIANEQPLLADLFDVPSATDVGLLCTNLRMMDGKRPVFIDHIDSTFFFPYRVFRFLEIPKGAVERHLAEGGRGVNPAAGTPSEMGADGEPMPGSILPAVIEETPGEAETDMGEEIDEDFLRRIRDI